MLSRAARLVRRPGGRMMAAFVAVPSAIFGLPAVAGVTWLVSDNLIQNFPLRVLVGIDLRHGHAPVWDPYLWSGSPLLSGFNAGAAYPATWLFSVLPGALAWVVNQALVEIVAAVGMVVLLRVLGRSWTASGLGAVAFSYGGFMAAQSVHIDVIEAGAWLPWAFAGPRSPGPSPRRSFGDTVGGDARRLDRAHGVVGGGRAHPRRWGRARPLRAVARSGVPRPDGGRSSSGWRPVWRWAWRWPVRSSSPARSSRNSRSGPCTTTGSSRRAR